jgi:hypothetical protein
MAVKSQLHAPAALPPERTPVFIEQGLGDLRTGLVVLEKTENSCPCMDC